VRPLDPSDPRAEEAEREEPALLAQEVRKREAAARVARRREVAQEVVLDVRAREEHVRLPRRARGAVEEHGRRRVLFRLERVFDRRRERDSGRAEPDADDVGGIVHVLKPQGRAPPRGW
jgi:hypothetical protein